MKDTNSHKIENMEKKIRGGIIATAIIACVLLPVSPSIKNVFQKTHADQEDVCANDSSWYCNGNYIVINGDDNPNTTWSGNVSYPDKPVVLVRGAILTIEPGTHVEINKLWVIDSSQVLAEGTKENNIVFTKPVFDPTTIPEDQKKYDQGCFINTEGMIEFDNNGSYDDDDPSVFKYVEFDGMGTNISYDADNCPWSGQVQGMLNVHSWLGNTAYAQRLATKTNPALEYESGKLEIENATFKNNSYTDIETNVTKNFSSYSDVMNYDFLHVENTNFENNQQDVAVKSYFEYLDVNSAFRIQLNNDWYGSPDGPQRENNSGSGEWVTGPARVNGWSQTEIENSIAGGASNVLFLPGVEGSRLYDKDGKLWEPMSDKDVQNLYLDSNGKSARNDVQVKDGNVLDKTPVGSNIYKSFIDQMNAMKSAGDINDWKPVAYDWRLSLDDLLSDGSIINTLRSLAANSKSGKVTIVAHSNGGLLAKAIMEKLGDDDAKNLVDKIIFVAVPQIGTPAAIPALLQGYEIGHFPVMNSQTARGLAENMSSAYNLLPSEDYFSTVGDPVATFDAGSSADWQNKYANGIDSKTKLSDFLSDDFRRVNATNSDVNTPAKLNKGLLEKAEQLHDGSSGLDAWKAPDGVKIIQIAGWGIPKTVSSTQYTVENRKYCDESLCYTDPDMLHFDVKTTIDGDGTVVAPSALFMGNADRYWVDLGKWNKDHPLETSIGFNSREHANIFEVPELLNLIQNSIEQKNSSLPQYLYNNVPPISGNPTRLVYSLHSPLTLNLYANINGKTLHTGVTADGQVEEQIPGTYYQQYGDVKYIYADEDVAGHIEMDGYAKGYFTFAVEELQGDDSKGKIVFKDVPTTPQTKATFDVPSNLASASDLNIDKDGDGTVDATMKPKIGEVVTFDETPPVTTASLAGTAGSNGWYTSNVALTLSAQDEAGGSGVAQTEYSTDGGTTWNAYGNPVTFSNEGTFNILYRSVDKQGNVENAKTQTIKIDKTAPEAKLTFDATAQKLNVIGTDNLGANVSVTTQQQTITPKNNQPQKGGLLGFLLGLLGQNTTQKTIVTATLTDQAGHQTQLVWDTQKNNDHLIDVALNSIAYDGNKTDIANGGVEYKWVLDWRKKNYLLFASRLKTSSSSVESHFFSGRNETWLMQKPADLADDENDDNAQQRPVWKKLSGMVIPAIMTAKGVCTIAY